MKRCNRLGPLEDLGSLPSPTEALAACPNVPLAGDLGGEASELRALFFDHVPAMSVSGFATAACAGDCGVEWYGNGRIAGGGCVSRHGYCGSLYNLRSEKPQGCRGR